MAKLKKQRMKKKYNYTKDRKRSWKNKNKLPKIKCAKLQEAWDEKKSVEQNMLDMGLSSDSNKTIRIPTAKELLAHSEAVKINTKKKKALKQHIADSLEKEASIPQEARLRIPDPEIKYCIYMMEKYGEDYKAMARDSRNHYQDTPKQIRKKINSFKNTSEQYQAYLRAKVYLSPFPSVVNSLRMAGARRVTRKYEAGRRNGHYNDTPSRTNSGASTTSSERVFSRVKRRLQFGRKPPQKRDVTPSTSASSRAGKKKSKTKGVKAAVRRTGSALNRELRNLMDAAVILPFRLRSAMRGATGKTTKKAGYRLKSSPEGTNLSRKSSKKRRLGEYITGNVFLN